MKKLFFALMAASMIVSCSTNEEFNGAKSLVLYGYSDGHAARTSFGTPDESKIPFAWSQGDYIWLGDYQSNPIPEDCTSANFRWNEEPSVFGGYHIFYNMTGTNKTARVLAEQSADGNLGNDGDFGYALADEFKTFVLSHKTSYFWFDTTTNDELPKLTTISISAPEGVYLAGEQVFDYEHNSWAEGISNGSSTITLSFEGEGHTLEASNSGVMAAAVALPAAIAGKTLTITYTFADGSTFTESKTPSKNLEAGAVRRIATTISKSDLEQPLTYELRVLDFEGDQWSALVDNLPFLGDILYPGDYWNDYFSWSDSGNTELAFTATEGWMGYSFYGGGHAISNYTKPGYAPENLQPYIEEYYDSYIESLHGWQYLQLLTPIGARSGDNFAVHFGYYDYAPLAMNMCTNLVSLKFEDEEPRVIDHMYVTNTNYALNQLIYGVTRADNPGDAFGGNYQGPGENSWFKIVAYGYASLDDDPVERGEADDRDLNPEEYVDGERVTKAEFYLLKGNADGYDVVLDWQKWDLSVLGPVAKVKFNVIGSDDMGGQYGLTIPGYFAYDDIAVRFEK